MIDDDWTLTTRRSDLGFSLKYGRYMTASLFYEPMRILYIYIFRPERGCVNKLKLEITIQQDFPVLRLKRHHLVFLSDPHISIEL